VDMTGEEAYLARARLSAAPAAAPLPLDAATGEEAYLARARISATPAAPPPFQAATGEEAYLARARLNASPVATAASGEGKSFGERMLAKMGWKPGLGKQRPRTSSTVE